MWARQFASQFWHGDCYPRWFMNVNAGYGGPSGFFYPPLTNYVSSLFWPFLQGRNNAGWLTSGYSLAVAFILSGITAYLWLRSLAGRTAAVIGALAYMIAPYHLATDVYIRGASAELWVFVWLPLVLLSAEGLFRRSWWASPGVALSYSLATLSHPSTALCFAPVALAYVILLSESKVRFRLSSTFAGALALGTTLDAVYLLPATFDQHKASVARYTSGATDYHRNWLLPSRGEILAALQYLTDKLAGRVTELRPGVAGYILILLVTLSTVAAVGALFVICRKYEAGSRMRRIALFYTTVTVITFFLTTKASALIWQATGFLKFLQFPSRLNVILAICLAVLAALAAPHALQARSRAITLPLALIALAWLAVDGWAPKHVYAVWGSNPAKSNQHWVQAQMEPLDMMARPANEDVPADGSEFDHFVATHPAKAVRLDASLTNHSSGTALVESWQPRRVLLHLDSSQASRLTINYFYYEGWQARVEGAKDIIPITPSPEGFMQLDVAPGSYELVVELPPDGAERAGKLISLLSLAVLGVMLITAAQRRTR